ncbi:DUF4127 family protein [Virgibacillus sp. MG-45]|uniref:DUF4127 family protein n=1 Tax=Virgibacillus sp. MG-45 TaxID=3102791 RepID=UPI002EDB1A8E
MKLGKAFYFILIFFLLIPGVQIAHAKDKDQGLANILLVPLDDRPANIYFPQKVGKAAGVNVITPPREIIGYYDSPGNSEEITKWLISNAEKADGFVLSTSMLAYGGLIASRTGEKTIEEAYRGIQIIKELKEKHPQKPIYVYDTIQRLAVTAINEDYAKYYDQIREWAILYDKVHNLGFEEDRARLEQLEAIIPVEVLEDYLRARERNHEVNKTLIEWTEDNAIDYLILAQDDAAPYGLHRAERELLVEKVDALNIEDKVAIFPGADEVDGVLVSRFVTKLFNETPTYFIEYGGIHGKDWIAPFEDTTFDENVMKHIIAAGADITTTEADADIHLILNTPSQEGDSRSDDINAMVNRIQELVLNNKQVAIGDVLIVNKADEDFVKTLAEKVDLTKILSYSGWNTAGNALGMTVGHATSRDAFLDQKSGFGVPVYKETAKAHYEFLLHRFAKDQGYKNVVQPATNQYILDIGANPWDLGSDYDVVNQFVRSNLTTETVKWYRNFDGKSVYIGSRGRKKFYSTINGLSDVHVKLPWPRTFEAELEPALKLE